VQCTVGDCEKEKGGKGWVAVLQGWGKQQHNVSFVGGERGLWARLEGKRNKENTLSSKKREGGCLGGECTKQQKRKGICLI